MESSKQGIKCELMLANRPPLHHAYLNFFTVLIVYKLLKFGILIPAKQSPFVAHYFKNPKPKGLIFYSVKQYGIKVNTQNYTFFQSSFIKINFYCTSATRFQNSLYLKRNNNTKKNREKSFKITNYL